MNPTLVRRTRHAHRFGRWPNVGFKNPTYTDGAVELLLFCKLIFFELVSGRLKTFQTAFFVDSVIYI